LAGLGYLAPENIRGFVFGIKPGNNGGKRKYAEQWAL